MSRKLLRLQFTVSEEVLCLMLENFDLRINKISRDEKKHKSAL